MAAAPVMQPQWMLSQSFRISVPDLSVRGPGREPEQDDGGGGGG